MTERELGMVTAIALAEARGILPDPGGWFDQSMAFTEAFGLVMPEIAHWRGVTQRIAQKKAEAARGGR